MASDTTRAGGAARQRRPKGSGRIKNRGTEKAPSYWAAHKVTVPTYRLVLADEVLLEHATEAKVQRLQGMQGGRVEVDGQRDAEVGRGGFKTKVAAEKWLREAIARKDGGRPTVPSKITVGRLLDDWLEAKRPDVSPSTAAEYERIVRERIKPHLGTVVLPELTPLDITRMVAALRQPGANHRGRTARPLSGTSIQHTYGVLTTALKWAVRARLIPYNPAEDVDRPARAHTEMQVWTAAELQQFLDKVGDHQLRPVFHLAAYTGMRRSELLGLQWGDVDLEHATVSVRRARVRVRYEMVDRPSPKSKRGRRVIDLDPATVAVLKAWATAQRGLRLEWGVGWRGQVPPTKGKAVVFTTEDGAPVHADTVATVFDRLVRQAGVPVIRFHDLRHTHASLLLAAGVPVKDVSERIGHASAAMTLDVYGHVLAGHGQRTAAAWAGIMGARSGGGIAAE
jgi:integrase